jgi:hypothetical protein
MFNIINQLLSTYKLGDLTVLALLDRTIQILSLLGNWVIAWYGFRLFWPKFKRQKRTENLMANAKETLHSAMALEQAIIELRVVMSDPMLSNEGGFDSPRTQAQLHVFAKLHELRNMLLLIKNERDIINKNTYHLVAEWTKKITLIIKTLYPTSDHEFASISWLPDWEVQLRRTIWDSHEFEAFKQALLNIHELHTVERFDKMHSMRALVKEILKYVLLMLTFIGIITLTMLLIATFLTSLPTSLRSLNF